jgi:hypothetical protein
VDSPSLCDRVHVRKEHDRTYIVIKIDEESRTVDLIAASGSTRVLSGVPFSELLAPGQHSGT